ncbi:MAG: signal peptidase II [Spirochaetaceae bacterium]|nr:signal peptidase II [Spirochaetaceae bacterium]
MTTDTVPVEFKKKETLAHKLIPLIFLVGVFAFDQITKFLVVKNIPLYTIKFSFFGDLLRIVHVRNLGAAFSMGSNLAASFRAILLSFLPLVVLIFALVIYFRSNDFSYYQRWLICGVLGGGFGNIFDRIFRPEGVVDFIDVKFFGLFGMERFPTFNVADSFVMVCAILLVISVINQIVREEKNKKAEEKK